MLKFNAWLPFMLQRKDLLENYEESEYEQKK